MISCLCRFQTIPRSITRHWMIVALIEAGDHAGMRRKWTRTNSFSLYTSFATRRNLLRLYKSNQIRSHRENRERHTYTLQQWGHLNAEVARGSEISYSKHHFLIRFHQRRGETGSMLCYGAVFDWIFFRCCVTSD